MAATSLSPGPLFSKAGINRTSTPVGLRATSQSIHEMFAREKYSEDHPWPRTSPVARVYDIDYTPTKLVLINERARPKSCNHLRRYSPVPPNSITDPGRHSPEKSPHKKPERHTVCLDSTTPVYKPKHNVDLHWRNRKMRPPWTPEEDSAVRSRYHVSCGVPRNPDMAWMRDKSPPRPILRARHKRPPLSLKNNECLNHPNLSRGNRNYLWNIAHAYDVARMHQLKQLQYSDLLLHQQYLGFHSTGEYKKYMRYIDGPRKRQFGGKSEVLRSGHRTPSGKRAQTPVSKRDGEPATGDTADTENAAPPPDEGTLTDIQLADKKEDFRKTPKTSRRCVSARTPRRGQARKLKSSVNQKAMGSGRDGGRTQRKQSAPLSRPKTRRERAGETESNAHIQDGGAVKSGAKTPTLQFLAVAMDGLYDGDTGDSNAASPGDVADATNKRDKEDIPEEMEQLQEGRSSGDVQNRYKVIPLFTRQESSTQTMATEETGKKEKPVTSTLACQAGDGTPIDIMVTVEDASPVTSDRTASIKGEEYVKAVNVGANKHTACSERTTNHELFGDEKVDDEGSATFREHAKNERTTGITADDIPEVTTEYTTEITEDDEIRDTVGNRTKTKEDDTIQAVTDTLTGMTGVDEPATKVLETKPTETASPLEDVALADIQVTNEDDKLTSEEAMALTKSGDGSLAEQSRTSPEELQESKTSRNEGSATEEKPSVEGQHDRTSATTAYRTERIEYSDSSSSGSEYTSTGSYESETEDEDDAVKQDNERSLPEDKPSVEDQPEITSLTNNDSADMKEQPATSSSGEKGTTSGNEAKETEIEKEGAAQQDTNVNVTDDTVTALTQLDENLVTNETKSETKERTDTARQSDSSSTESSDDESSYSGSESETESERSTASSRQSDSKMHSMPTHQNKDAGERDSGQSGSTESFAAATSTGLTSEDMARLHAAEDALSLGTTSSTENQSNDSSESSSFTGRLGSTTANDRENPAAWRPSTARGPRTLRPGGQEGTVRPKSRLGNRPSQMIVAEEDNTETVV